MTVGCADHTKGLWDDEGYLGTLNVTCLQDGSWDTTRFPECYQACKTVVGEKCRFPFSYGGLTYDTCSELNGTSSCGTVYYADDTYIGACDMNAQCSSQCGATMLKCNIELEVDTRTVQPLSLNASSPQVTEIKTGLFELKGCVNEFQVLSCSDPSAVMTLGPRDSFGNSGTIDCRKVGFYTNNDRLSDGKTYQVFCIPSTTTSTISSTSTTTVTTTSTITTTASTTTTAVPSTTTTAVPSTTTTTAALGSQTTTALVNTTTEVSASLVTSNTMTDSTTLIPDNSSDNALAADNSNTTANPFDVVHP
ncbi:mucin-22-like [Penaeus indicus]|uniref:mucin-22-like n=1 Tax=Penaeus indicus TaxID=29960 RepID=UPI00300DAFB9